MAVSNGASSLIGTISEPFQGREDGGSSFDAGMGGGDGPGSVSMRDLLTRVGRVKNAVLRSEANADQRFSEVFASLEMLEAIVYGSADHIHGLLSEFSDRESQRGFPRTDIVPGR